MTFSVSDKPGMSLQEIIAQRDALNARIQELQQVKTVALDRVVKVIAQYGLSLEDIAEALKSIDQKPNAQAQPKETVQASPRAEPDSKPASKTKGAAKTAVKTAKKSAAKSAPKKRGRKPAVAAAPAQAPADESQTGGAQPAAEAESGNDSVENSNVALSQTDTTASSLTRENDAQATSTSADTSTPVDDEPNPIPGSVQTSSAAAPEDEANPIPGMQEHGSEEDDPNPIPGMHASRLADATPVSAAPVSPTPGTLHMPSRAIREYSYSRTPENEDNGNPFNAA